MGFKINTGEGEAVWTEVSELQNNSIQVEKVILQTQYQKEGHQNRQDTSATVTV